jgi:hypothetical protein
MAEVPQHVMRRRLTEIVITPEHAQREESAAFRRNKARLREDGHWRCWLCGTTDQLQVHHFACEWSLWPDADPAKVKAFVETFDPYGYGRLLRHRPLDSPDDIRNLLVLCEACHIGQGTGVHAITMPIWLIQGLAKPGADPVPRKEES